MSHAFEKIHCYKSQISRGPLIIYVSHGNYAAGLYRYSPNASHSSLLKRVYSLTTGCRTGESATVRDITEQYRSIRHHLHVDPAFQLTKQLRGPYVFFLGRRPYRSLLDLDRTCPGNRRVVRRIISEKRTESRFKYEMKYLTHDRPSTHLRDLSTTIDTLPL